MGSWATVETVTTGYNAVGAAVTLNGNSPYVTASSFTDQGRIASRTLGSGVQAVTRTYGWNTATGRLESMTATQGGVAVQQDSMVYDPVGNLLSVTHDQAGVGSDHSECFSYDARSRLVQAYTTVLTGGAPCPAGSTVSGPGGYLTSLAVDEIGNLTQGPDGVYSYLASGAGSIRPHAPTATSNSTMVWNNDGTLATKTVTATSARLSYTWDGFNRLTKVTDTTIPTSPVDVQQMIYGPGGERVLMKDTAGVHLYLGGLAERHLTGAVVTDKRYYTIGDTTVAVRTKIAPAASYVDFLLGDIRGSIAMTVRENTTTTTEQWYTPYGTTRAGNTTTTTTRGYIGQTHDTTTNLNYLHNRYQDPQTGVFLSVDPLVATTGQPYLYGNGNPTTLTDPNGLCAGREGSRGGCGVDYYGGGGSASFKNGRFDDYGLYCGQGRNGVYGGLCNSYGIDPDGGNWSDGNYWVSSAACGDRCEALDQDMLMAQHGFNDAENVNSGIFAMGAGILLAVFGPETIMVCRTAVTMCIGRGGRALAPAALDLANGAPTGEAGTLAVSSESAATNTADDFANWGGEFVDDAIRAPATRPDFANISAKIERQMQTRGWTPELIDEAVISGEKFPALNKLGGANTPATRYVSPTTGQSVVIDNATGEIVQVGGPGFKYGAG